MVLVVDDDLRLRALIVRLLTDAGRRPVAAANAEEADRVFAPGRFSHALIDVDLGPGPDGVALARGLQRRDPALLIVLMSGSFNNLEKARLAGFNRLLPKPFDADAVSGLFA